MRGIPAKSPASCPAVCNPLIAKRKPLQCEVILSLLTKNLCNARNESSHRPHSHDKPFPFRIFAKRNPEALPKALPEALAEALPEAAPEALPTTI